MVIIKEAFQSGSSQKIVQKIVSVVNKKVSGQILLSDIGYGYQNQDGKFVGYYGTINNDTFRINFKLGSSDSVYSLDWFFSQSGKPDVTVLLNEFSITQVVEALIDEFNSPSKVLQEAEKRAYVSSDRKKMLFDAWIKEEKNAIEMLQNRKLSIVYTLFLKKDSYNSELNLASFTQLAKEFLFSKGLSNPAFRKRKVGTTEKEIEDKVMEDRFIEIVKSMHWTDKFEFIRGAITQMYHERVNSIYIYGNPETGKTYEVLTTLDKLNADYVVFKGPVIRKTDDLIKILYDNRKDRILVFDDADKVIQDTDPNIWKTLLVNSKSRIIDYVNTSRTKSKAMAKIPNKFEFTSGVIFISNIPKLNSAIASRSLVMDVKLSNAEALEKVESTLKKFLPEVSMTIKKQAIEYAKEISGGIKNMGYRSVETIIIAMQISPKNWKKQAIWLLSSR